MIQVNLPVQPNRGCSDFCFVPGTNDCHVLVLRTEVGAVLIVTLDM